ncbi:4-hydroxythreonine-4-phosphate dehydrogenase PdxA [Cupriavidus necator]|uniref:4-hydroxythreonine-4-phosphate dehydrogenase n=2 Tax=Cupriavidus necator TaxID=106590 RepID=Q0KEA8_CUPNH|nr:4-hydroxythreonine-4-phosphate dehydrogenase PdxA [Cupriavidus necator]QCB99602.1 4-hydroxythreonine-4-phosphate dehydrogenase PdxA [Cupriavidus necator H16]QQB77581.1 4-hydroxythreonine-4-phosphate dehydrogenase PdxA [Cupriavidus necator]WKA41436.1 4-hydroxythreonine-4-phosphate dehydrogenase PdxA [Cupriavidus necator]CAJ91663.1 4-Hydroxythreonine-4-phosphate dehydrogenase [Cupriavidus necator H16]SCU73516.1 4-hydroxy-L-threonine phosphate dehydrogenase, NAD-dependent [Cupriavidus necator]
MPDPLALAISTGEPAGIGPDITIGALLQLAGANNGVGGGQYRFHVLGDARLLADRAAALGATHAWERRIADGDVVVEDIPLAVACEAGRLDARNGPYVLKLLDAAIRGCRARGKAAPRYAAMITAPVQKSTINDAGVPFTGHTEYLAESARVPRVVMMLAGPQPAHDGAMLRVALATTHLPLRAVPDALSVPLLVQTLSIIDADLRRYFGISRPRILVTGLNPHAGESGHMGREEIDIITPALAQAKDAGIDARGPFPADTLFQPRHLRDADCVLAMYHDQGLAPLKYGTFGHGVNITLGLPFIRTSVDHGTALDLAGTGQAEHGSMIEAIRSAVTMAGHANGRRPGSNGATGSHPGHTHSGLQPPC